MCDSIPFHDIDIICGGPNHTQHNDSYRHLSPPPPLPQGGAAMYVENSFAGREVNGPVMLCVHPHGAYIGGPYIHIYIRYMSSCCC